MKTLRMSLAMAGLFLAGSLFAQQSVRATIPFDFHVGNSEVMPSGTYQIAPCSTNVIVVRNCNSGVAVLHVTQTGETKDQGKLVFRKYGDKYFLSEVQGLASGGLVVPVTKNEKKIKTEMASVTTSETSRFLNRMKPSRLINNAEMFGEGCGAEGSQSLPSDCERCLKRETWGTRFCGYSTIAIRSSGSWRCRGRGWSGRRALGLRERQDRPAEGVHAPRRPAPGDLRSGRP